MICLFKCLARSQVPERVEIARFAATSIVTCLIAQQRSGKVVFSSFFLQANYKSRDRRLRKFPLFSEDTPCWWYERGARGNEKEGALVADGGMMHACIESNEKEVGAIDGPKQKKLVYMLRDR